MGTEIWDFSFPVMFLTLSSILVGAVFAALGWKRFIFDGVGESRRVPISLLVFTAAIGLTVAGYIRLLLYPPATLTRIVVSVLTQAAIAYLVVLVVSVVFVCASFVIALSENGTSAKTVVKGSKTLLVLYALGFIGVGLGLRACCGE
jgi:hypothetical protein